MSAAPPEGRAAALVAMREELGGLLGAERRLRGRDQHRKGEGVLTSAHVRALFALGAHEEATAGQIAESARLSPGAVTGMLDELEKAGIVRRVRCEDDRRRVLVSLTDEGRELLGEKRRGWAKGWEETMATVPDRDLVAAAGVIGRIAAMLDEL
jgi:MarR family transcriptional regulator, organic hydroperoxide resistance regulator